jgi:hypothetical protein
MTWLTRSSLRWAWAPTGPVRRQIPSQEQHAGTPPTKRAKVTQANLPASASAAFRARSSRRPHQLSPQQPRARNRHKTICTIVATTALLRPTSSAPPPPREGEGRPRRRRHTRALPRRRPPIAAERKGGGAKSEVQREISLHESQCKFVWPT